MPRIRQKEETYALNDLVGEIKAQSARFGFASQSALSRDLGCCQATVGNILREPGTIPLSRMRQLVKVLKLDPVIVMKALGYTEKELRARFREGAA